MQIRENPAGAQYGRTLVGGHLIGGGETGADGGARFLSRNPAYTDDVVGDFPLGGRAEVEAACKAAREAYPMWRSTPAPVRGVVLARLAEVLVRDKVFLSRLLTREIGKPLREAEGEVQEAIDTAHFFMSEGRRLYGQTVPSELRRKELQTYRRPLGVCAMITAGNFPCAVPAWKIIPALLCGNTVVWKPSEDAPAIGYAFANAFREAGLPDGVLNVVFGTGGGGAGEELIAAIDRGLINKISFTGSTQVGMRIGEVAGRNLQVPSLELGGKNPLVVMDDANLDLAITGALWAGYGTAGQRCTSLGNLILHEKIADEFVGRYVGKIKALRIGNPNEHRDIDYGPMISERFADTYCRHHAMAKPHNKALLKGDRMRTGKEWPHFRGDAAKGIYVTPTLYDGVRIEDDLAQTEVFGPTVNIIRVKSFDEAIAAANGTKYGLSSAIYTDCPTNRLRFKEEISAGMTSINNSTTGAEAHMPFGGNGWSGNGTRESGVWVIDAYTRWHGVNIDDSGALQLAQMDTESAQQGKAADLKAVMA
jgi:aldehyde dehydrogenase (NAD+)